MRNQSYHTSSTSARSLPRQAIHQALKHIAQSCDGARSRDGTGFSKHDADRGLELASKKNLTRREAREAKRLIQKYRRQVPSYLYEQIFPESATDEDGQVDASHPPVGPEDDITPDVLGEEILKTEHFAKDRGDSLYHFEGGRYVRNGDDFVKRRVKALLGSWGMLDQWRSNLAKEVVKYILVDSPLLWDRPPTDVVNVLNGLLDVRTGKLRPYSPDHLSSIQLPVRFDRNAKCPAWRRFVRDVFPRDAQQSPWEILGDLMVPDRSIQKAFLPIGEGGTGKSRFLAGATAFVGRENVSNVDLHKLEGNRFATAQLLGKLANISADLPSRDLHDTAIFKAVTGGDRIEAERKFKPAFAFLPHVRLLFSANHAPKSKDTSEAFWDRWLVCPFENKFRGTPGEIPREQLDAQLADPKELSGVLNLALRALRKVRKRGHFTESESMRKAKQEFGEVTDHCLIWLNRKMIRDPKATVGVSLVRRRYNEAAEQAGWPVMTATQFGKAFRETLSRYQEDAHRSEREAGVVLHRNRIWKRSGVYLLWSQRVVPVVKVVTLI